jgi:hypothetical protein
MIKIRSITRSTAVSGGWPTAAAVAPGVGLDVIVGEIKVTKVDHPVARP